MRQIVPEPLIRGARKRLCICVAGAGAIGIGITLATRMSISEYSVGVLARGESLVAIRKNGLSLTDVEEAHMIRKH